MRAKHNRATSLSQPRTLSSIARKRDCRVENMGLFTINHPLQFSFGLLGNIVSMMVYLSPLPTFYGIYKKKSTQGFQSIPYVIALFSSMLWIYYAFLKSDAYLLITINSFGCVVETIYISMFIAYAPRKARILTTRLLILLNLGAFCLILLLTIFLVKRPNRVIVLGWICVAFSATVFAAPLSVLRMVMRTKSVEFMPFWLSFFLTLSAVAWFSYGFLLKDIYIAIPNVLGFFFGATQMILYAIYKDNKKTMDDKIAADQPNIDVKSSSVAIHSEEHQIAIDVPREHHENSVVDDDYDSKVIEQIIKNAKNVEELVHLPPSLPLRPLSMSTNPNNMMICLQA